MDKRIHNIYQYGNENGFIEDRTQDSSDRNQNFVTDDGIVQHRINDTITDVRAAIHQISPSDDDLPFGI